MFKAPQPNAVGSIWLVMSLDVEENERTIYSFFDFLADVGGLKDMLFEIGGFLLSFISFLWGSNLKRLLIYNLFKLDYNMNQQKTN